MYKKMEEKNITTVAPNEYGKKKINKGVIILLVIVVLVLCALIAVLLSRMSDKDEEARKVQIILEEQRKVLENDLTELQGQFGALETDNDSLKNLANEQQERITKLLAEKADNTYKITMYRKELESLREVLRSYIVQVDSLNRHNIILRDQNATLAQNLNAERTQSARLTQDRDRLTSTVQKAQILSASDIVTTGLNKSGKDTPRVRNVATLQTSFVVRENQVATPGERLVYVAIIAPDKKTLGNKANETIATQDGAEIVYTDKRVVDYQNSDLEVRIFTDNNNRLTAGNYQVMIYCEGYMIGSSTFILR